MKHKMIFTSFVICMMLASLAVFSGIITTSDTTDGTSASDGLEISLGDGKTVLLATADDKWCGYGVYAWRLQGSVEITEESGEYIVTGMLLYYDEGSWTAGTWSDNMSAGYYLVLDFTGSNVTFTKIGDITYSDGWNTSTNPIVMCYMGSSSVSDSISFYISGNDDVAFKLNTSDLDSVENICYLGTDITTSSISISSAGIYRWKGSLSGVPSTGYYCLIVPSAINGKNITGLQQNAPINDSSLLGNNLKYVVLGENVKTLGSGVYSNVFRDCTSLIGINTLGELASIGPCCFSGCTSLKSIDIQGTISFATETGGVFDNCTNLEEIRITGDISNANDSGYYYASKTSNYIVSEFKNCTSLSRIVIAGDNVNIGSYMFSNYENNEINSAVKCVLGPYTLEIEGSNCIINNYAFSNSTITAIDGMENISSIGIYSFSNSNLISVSIPKNITTNLDTAFSNCNSLVSFSIDSNNTAYTYDSGIIYNHGKTGIVHAFPSLISGSVTIPETVTSIPSNAFQNCTGITDVTLPEGLESIGSYAFSGCTGISEVVIPSTVTSIGSYSFYGCADVGTMTYLGDKSVISFGTDYKPSGWTEVEEYNATGIRVYFSTEHGEVIATWTNGSTTYKLRSGSVIPNGTVILTFDSSSYDLLSWNVTVDGETVVTSGNTLTISSDEYASNVTVTTNLRYYSQSNVTASTIDIKTAITNEDWAELWEYLSDETKSNSSATVWTITCTPLIIDDYVYAYTGTSLYKIDSLTGEIVCQVTVATSGTAYYMYLGYSDGFIIYYATGDVYDTDLNIVANVGSEITSSFYDDGYTYGLYSESGTTVLKKFCIVSSEDTETGYDVCFATDGAWSEGVDVTGWYGSYGTTSAPVFSDSYLYYLKATTSTNDAGSTVPYKIYLCSVDLEDGAEVEQDLGLDYRYLDDGWLTLYDDTIYLTSYNTGLFEDSSGDVANSYISVISLRDGGFMALEFNVDLGYNGVTSQFVIYNGRGYVNVANGGGSNSDAYFLVFDVDNLSASATPIYSVKSTYTHGSIVVNTAYATEDNGYTVYVYLVPYYLSGTSSYIWMFTDCEDQTSGSVTKLASTALFNYSSQAVRVGSSGQLIWYTDPGVVYCYGSVSDMTYYFFVQDGTDGYWVSSTGSSLSEAFKNAVSGLDRISVSDDGIITINGKTADIYVLSSDSWTSCTFTDSGVNKYSTFFITAEITDENDIDIDKCWYISDTSTSYTFSDLTDDHSLVDTLFCEYAVYTVTYESNGGSESAPVNGSLFKEGETFVVSSYSGTVEGYTFAGWGDGTDLYLSDSTYCMGSSDLILTAVWYANITYDANGGSESAPIQGAVAEGDSFIIASYTGTLTGYTFVGWSDGSDTYEGGSEYSMGSNPVTFTAVWEINMYSVTYDTNGGSGNAPVQDDVEYNGTFTIGYYSGKLTGYTFVGWSDGYNIYFAGSTYTMGTSDVTLKAVWRIVNVNGVTLNRSYLTMEAGESSILVATTTPTDAIDDGVTWSSSDTSVVRIDSDGNVTAVSVGTAIITVTTDYLGYTDTCAVTVTRSSDNVTVTASGSDGSYSVTVSSSIIQNTGGYLIVQSDLGNISFSEDVLESLSDIGGDMTIRISEVDLSDLTATQRTAVGNGKVLSFTITMGSTSVSDLGGTVTVTLPYELSSDEDPENVKVYYLTESGNMESIYCSYDYEDQTVSFTTDHFSYYVVTYENASSSSNDSNNLAYIAVIAVVLSLFIVLAAYYVMKRRMNNEKQ